MRSLLVIPSPSLSDFNAGLDSGADALVLNFEEAPLDTQELAARMSACMAVNITLFIKVHPLNHPAHFDDLRVAVEGGAAGVILSSCKGENITQLAARLAVAEAEAGRANNTTRIIAEVATSGRSLFDLGTYGGRSSRLDAMVWNAAALAADVGSSSVYTAPCQLARSLTLAGAAAARIAAIDTAFSNPDDEQGLLRECSEAVRDGFKGKYALFPAQVSIINTVFAQA